MQIYPIKSASSKYLFLLSLVMLLCVRDQARQQPVRPHLLKQYHAANSLFNLNNPTEETDQKAIKGFDKIIETYAQEKLSADSVLLLSYIKKGVIHEVYNNYHQAKRDYLDALKVKVTLTAYTDSIYFPIYLYTGSTYYHLNQFDSARFFFEKAENLLSSFPISADKNRLYNSFGALFYETGNYRQSHNYFVKALELTSEADKEARINLQINIAATAIKLQQYESAIQTYNELISGKVYTDEIYQNMGKAYKSLGKNREALYYFRKVNPVKVPAVINEIALAYIKTEKHDSAEHFLNKLSIDNPRVNATDLGTKALYKGYLLVKEKKFTEALYSFHQAVVYLSAEDFQDTGISANPVNYTGTFTSFKLFEALVQKGKVLHELYRISGDQKQLSSSLNAYESAIGLVSYIEQSFDTDEARLFIKNNTQPAFAGALNACIELFRRTGNSGHLEKGFLLVEKNKASVLSAVVRENRLKKMYGVSPELLQEERNIKWNLARLLQKADSETDPVSRQSIAKEKMDAEIRLSQLVKQIEKNEAYQKFKYAAQVTDIRAIQNLLPDDQVVISFTIADSVLHVFLIDHKRFQYLNLGFYNPIQTNIGAFARELKNMESGKRFKGEEFAFLLYRQLIKPVWSFAANASEWVIIPDGSLYYLPFEALQESAESELLLTRKTISYHFSTAMLAATKKEKKTRKLQVLGIAPFSDLEGNMGALPASGSEIRGLQGIVLVSSEATKEAFISNANRFPVIHLATHAVANTENPSASFISFFPDTNSTSGNLYLDELYGITLDSAKLVIMSACETGDGKLINSEGVMSLSRGFAYAGVQSIVTSLWKADDEATAFITKKFHYYLNEGYSKSEALRQSKIDFRNSEYLHKTPNYWANLVLIGDPAPLVTRQNNWLGLLFISVLLIAGISYLLVRKNRRKEKKSTHS